MIKSKLPKRIPGGKATVAGAIGSAAVAAALMYASNRRKKANKPNQLPHLPGGEKPETD